MPPKKKNLPLGSGTSTTITDDTEPNHLNNGEYYEVVQAAEVKVLSHTAFKNIKDTGALPIAKAAKKPGTKKDASGGFVAGFNEEAYHKAMETAGKYMAPGNLWHQDLGLKQNCYVFIFS